jgi:molybdopterin-guanine dinucleotide biosynthesis protein B
MRIFGFAGWSGSGKTTLIEKLIPLFTARGLRVSLIKHAHHKVDVDKPGKDSYRFREAGAVETLLTSDSRWALMHELRGAPSLTFEESIRLVSPCDLLLIEGFKYYPAPKMEIWRQATGQPPLYPGDEHIVALSTDTPEVIKPSRPLRQFDLNQPETMLDFIQENALDAAQILRSSV